jgi:hypothetical protein
MYLLIEHDGTEDNNNLARALKNIAEDNFGATCEYIIGDSPEIAIYDENQKELIKFNGPRSDADLNYIIDFIIEDEAEQEVELQKQKLMRKNNGI